MVRLLHRLSIRERQHPTRNSRPGQPNHSIPVAKKKTHPQPTVNYIYRDYLRIFRSNENYRNDLRSNQYKTLARTGNHTTSQPTSTYVNTNEVAALLEQPRQPPVSTISRKRRPHHLRSRDHRYNSSNHHNMAIGQSYRKWFQRTISRHHYSHGEDPNHPPHT